MTESIWELSCDFLIIIFIGFMFVLIFGSKGNYLVDLLSFSIGMNIGLVGKVLILWKQE